MSQFMTHLLYSSFSAAVLIVAVLLIRLIVTKKAPRWVACVLWGMVGVRLLIPFSIESELSILPEIELSSAESETDLSESGESSEESFGESITESFDTSSDAESVESKGEVIDEMSVPSVGEVSDDRFDESSFDESEEVSEESFDMTSKEESDETTDETADETSDETTDETSEETTVSAPVAGTVSEQSDGPQGGQTDLGKSAQIIWFCGAVALVLYAAVQYILLRRRVAVFSVDENGIRRCEQIDTPFVLGFFRPRVYLPFGLTDEVKTYIIAHERAHISRFDHVSKTVAFAALALHWFNPFVWLAFVLFCRDIEYACDEKVVRYLSFEERKQYASALLSCASRKR